MSVTLEQMMQLTDPTRESAAKTPFRIPAHLPADSEDYCRRVEGYARRIRSTRDVALIVAILDEALADTRALHGRNESSATEKRLHQAEGEIRALKIALEQTVALTNLDPLTGVLNRRGLESSFNAEASRSDRQGTSLCAAILDIDDFKRINDTHGHPVGDAVLTRFSSLVRTSLRPNDVLVRVGGEEFMILLPDCNEAAAFAALNRLLRNVLSQPLACGTTTVAMTFTAGVTLRGFGETQATIYSRLDEVLIRAKQSGKNRVMFATR